MEPSDVKKQINNWLDSKMNSPYFGAVIAVWVVTNRVLVFGILNFDEKLSKQERISFVHQQLDSFTRLDFLFGFHGFWATVVWSFFWGLIAMLIADQINTLGKVVYKWGHQSKNYLLQKIEPSKWIEKEKYDEIKAQSDDYSDQIKLKREEGINLQRNYENSIDLYNKEKKENQERDKKIVEQEANIKLSNSQLQQYVHEKNKFRIIYARYGKYDKYIEVTKTVTDLISSQGKFPVNNETLGFDPNHFRIKDVVIEYEFNNTVQNITANEEEIVELKENELTRSSTVKSDEKQRWLANQQELGNLFKDQWTLIYTDKSGSHSEDITIDDMGNYLIEGEPAFILNVPILDKGKITMAKNNLDGTSHSIENLKMITSDLFTGDDNIGYTLQYSRNPNSGENLLAKRVLGIN